MDRQKLSSTIKNQIDTHKTALIAAGALLTGIALTVIAQKENGDEVNLHFDKAHMPNLSRGLGKIEFEIDGDDYYLSKYEPTIAD